MLSFELRKPRLGEMPDELEVFLDASGLEALLHQLRFLQGKRADHVHLMCESWGGYELDDQSHNAENTPICHVKIYIRN
jgi:hypothetical protein